MKLQILELDLSQIIDIHRKMCLCFSIQDYELCIKKYFMTKNDYYVDKKYTKIHHMFCHNINIKQLGAKDQKRCKTSWVQFNASWQQFRFNIYRPYVPTCIPASSH